MTFARLRIPGDGRHPPIPQVAGPVPREDRDLSRVGADLGFEARPSGSGVHVPPVHSTFNEHLLYDRLCSRCWRSSGDQFR